MNAFDLRKGKLAIKISVEPDDGEKVDKELEEEGLAPHLKEVDGKKPEQPIDMLGEDEMDPEMEPRTLRDRVKLEMLKKKGLNKEQV